MVVTAENSLMDGSVPSPSVCEPVCEDHESTWQRLKQRRSPSPSCYVSSTEQHTLGPMEDPGGRLSTSIWNRTELMAEDKSEELYAGSHRLICMWLSLLLTRLCQKKAV